MNTSLTAAELEYQPNVGTHETASNPIVVPDLPLGFYHSNEVAMQLGLFQRIFRLKTLTTVAMTAAFETGSMLITFKLWPMVMTKTFAATASDATAEIGSFSGAQSINDLVPLLFVCALALVVLFLAAVIPLRLGLWWWQREAMRMPWDAPVAEIGEYIDRGSIFDRGPIFGEAV